METLNMVLEKLNKLNTRINEEKSEFLKDSLEYCGHVITKNGMEKENRKKRQQKSFRPCHIEELTAFIDLINYYGKFIRNLNEILHPLNDLLKIENRFKWFHNCEREFRAAKRAFCSEEISISFNPT